MKHPIGAAFFIVACTVTLVTNCRKIIANSYFHALSKRIIVILACDMLEHVPNKTIKSKYVNMFFEDIQFSHVFTCKMHLENLLVCPKSDQS